MGLGTPMPPHARVGWWQPLPQGFSRSAWRARGGGGAGPWGLVGTAGTVSGLGLSERPRGHRPGAGTVPSRRGGRGQQEPGGAAERSPGAPAGGAPGPV